MLESSHFSFNPTYVCTSSLLRLVTSKDCLPKSLIDLSGHVLLNPFPNKPLFFKCLPYKTFENTLGKEQIAHNE